MTSAIGTNIGKNFVPWPFSTKLTDLLLLSKKSKALLLARLCKKFAPFTFLMHKRSFSHLIVLKKF